MNKILLLAFGLIISLTSFGQTPEEIIDKFFTEYENVGADEALDNLYATSEWMGRNQDATQNVKSQLANLQSLVGTYYGREFITKKSVGKSLSLYSYLVKYDRQPLRFTFEFYKPNDKWTIFGFSFDENLDDELEEAAKVYRLPENYRE